MQIAINEMDGAGVRSQMDVGIQAFLCLLLYAICSLEP